MKSEVDFKDLIVVQRLPQSRSPESAETIPDGLIGSRIFQVVIPDDKRLVEDGGIVIDFISLVLVEEH